jgi:hypothetical protein
LSLVFSLIVLRDQDETVGVKQTEKLI